METEVGKRISWEMQAAAQARLERAAEIGKLAREREQLQLSSLDLSGDLKLAKEERARAAPETKAKDTADMSLAERLDMLSDEVAKRLEAEAAPERAAREEEARRRALDVAQQQDPSQGRGRSRGRSIGDDDELKRKLDRGKDFGLER
jgi:hypothetical protein